MRCVCLCCSLFLLIEGLQEGQAAVRRGEQELQKVQRDLLRRSTGQQQEQQWITR